MNPKGGESKNYLAKLLEAVQRCVFFEKINVITSIDDWQTMRALRNLAAHEYEIDYAATAEHFNSLQELIPRLYAAASAFTAYCRDTLNVTSASNDFTPEFNRIVHSDSHANHKS